MWCTGRGGEGKTNKWRRRGGKNKKHQRKLKEKSDVSLSPSPTDHLLNIDVNMMEQTKFFCNKIWQTFRFLLSALEKEVDKGLSCTSPVQHSNRWGGWGVRVSGGVWRYERKHLKHFEECINDRNYMQELFLHNTGKKQGEAGRESAIITWRTV